MTPNPKKIQAALSKPPSPCQAGTMGQSETDKDDSSIVTEMTGDTRDNHEELTDVGRTYIFA